MNIPDVWVWKNSGVEASSLVTLGLGCGPNVAHVIVKRMTGVIRADTL